MVLVSPVDRKGATAMAEIAAGFSDDCSADIPGEKNRQDNDAKQ
jgi:hypothetical protein